MMIDCHVHSAYSKHAQGTLEQIVLHAIEKRVKVLTFTDHAPFPIDQDNRLSLFEMERYFTEIARLQKQYAGYIVLLKGLECDFLPQYYSFTQNLLTNIDIDYVIGSIHRIVVDGDIIPLWSFKGGLVSKNIDIYFEYMKELIQSNLFDCIGHPDLILNMVVDEADFVQRLSSFIALIKTSGVSWELNASGLFKKPPLVQNSRYDIFPAMQAVKLIGDYGIKMTLGSDAHSPSHISRGNRYIIEQIAKIGVEELFFYERRQPVRIGIKDFL